MSLQDVYEHKIEEYYKGYKQAEVDTVRYLLHHGYIKKDYSEKQILDVLRGRHEKTHDE